MYYDDVISGRDFRPFAGGRGGGKGQSVAKEHVLGHFLPSYEREPFLFQ